MTWDWQDVAALAVVGSAMAYLALKFVPGLTRKSPASGCAHCPVKSAGAGSCHDRPAVITLTAPRPGPGKPPAGPGSVAP